MACLKRSGFMTYKKKEIFTPETTSKLAEHYKDILGLLGEDPSREGLLKTPAEEAFPEPRP